MTPNTYYSKKVAKPIGIFGALDAEIALLLKELHLMKKDIHNQMTFYLGYLSNQEVILCKAGEGKVNTAIIAQILITRYHVHSIIFTGVAGAINPNVNLFDLVISTEAAQYDVNFTALGYPTFTIPAINQAFFKSDPTLLNLAFQATKGIPNRVFKGRILSADQFLDDCHMALYLSQMWGGLAVEAEGGALGQVCSINDIPFVMIRTISDLAWLCGQNPEQFEDLVKQAAIPSQQVVLKMLQSI